MIGQSIVKLGLGNIVLITKGVKGYWPNSNRYMQDTETASPLIFTPAHIAFRCSFHSKANMIHMRDVVNPGEYCFAQMDWQLPVNTLVY